MSFAHWNLDQVAPKVAYALLHFLWQGLVVYVIWLSVLPLLRRAQSRYLFSLVTLLALAVLPFWTLTTWQPAPQPLPSSHNVMLELDANVRHLASTWGWQSYVVALWSLGVALLSAKLMLGYAGLVGLRRGLQPLAVESIPGLAAWREGLRRQVTGRLFATERVREAVVIGFYRPMILIPTAWLTEMPPEMLEAVIAHEMAHIRRFDLWVNLLQRFLETVLFYHPVVWLVSKRARWERELCCDEMAVATTGERLTYVDALSWVASRSIVSNRPVLSAAILGDRKMRLLARVKNVLQVHEGDERGGWWAAAVLAIALPLSAWVVAGAQERDKEEGAKAERRERVVRRDGDRDRAERRDGDRDRDRERGRRDGDRERTQRESDRDRDRGSRDADRRHRESRERSVRRDGDREHSERHEHNERHEHSAEAKERAQKSGLLFLRRRQSEEAIRREHADRDRAEARRVAEVDRVIQDRANNRALVIRGYKAREPETVPARNRDADLVRLISELKREVQQLRREVQALRHDRGEHRGADAGGHGDDVVRGTIRRAIEFRPTIRKRPENAPQPRADGESDKGRKTLRWRTFEGPREAIKEFRIERAKPAVKEYRIERSKSGCPGASGRASTSNDSVSHRWLGSEA